MLARQILERVVVDEAVLLAHGVVDRTEPLAGLVDVLAVGEVAAGGEIHAHEHVAWLHQGHEHGLVRLRAGVGLHVGELATEQRFGPVDRQPLDVVDLLAAAVVAPAWIALGVLVGEHRSLRLEHGARDDVLRRDQLDLPPLPREFPLDWGEQLRITLGEAGGEEGVGGVGVRRGGLAQGDSLQTCSATQSRGNARRMEQSDRSTILIEKSFDEFAPHPEVRPEQFRQRIRQIDQPAFGGPI